MKAIDMSHMEVVYCGIPWMHEMAPCSKHAIQLLEKNTKVVTWIMPKGGDVKEQIPCIVFKEKHYSLSLRMQKAIYRHIRLKKGFQNEENMDGMAKLRIPDVLLKEKMRTQSRFDAMRNTQRLQGSKQVQQQAGKEKRERVKSSNTVAARMKQVVDKMILSQKEKMAHPQITIFLYKSEQSEIIASFFQEMRRENTSLFEDKNIFMNLIASRYDEIKASHVSEANAQ